MKQLEIAELLENIRESKCRVSSILHKIAYSSVAILNMILRCLGGCMSFSTLSWDRGSRKKGLVIIEAISLPSHQMKKEFKTYFA